MITKNHESLYVDLFKMANEKLGYSSESEKYINTIDKYFESLADLVTEDNDPLFAILPADEDLFEIDANKRKITVPSSFSGGASVVGDEIAETIYFSIDRYFDITDFSNENLIPIVQWEITNNGKKEIGYSTTTRRTINLIPDKVVFGWPLSSEITKAAGNVTFSVRFYEIGKNDNGEAILTYSFSTQPAVIKINNSLVLDLIDGGIEETNKLNLMYSRVRSSMPANVNFHAVLPLLDMAPYSSKNNCPAFGKEYNLIDGALQLVAKSYFEDGTSKSQRGNQIYTWYREDASGNIEEIGNADETVYVFTDDSIDNSTEEYWVKDGENFVPYDHDAIDFNADSIYEKAYGKTITKGGKYFLKITNEISNSNFKTLEVKKEHGYITIPLPQLVNFDGNNKNAYHAIIEDDSALLTLNVNNPDGDTSVVTYQWIDADDIVVSGETALSEPNYFINEEGEYRLKATNSKNNDSSAISISEPIIVTYPASIPVISKYLVGRYDLSSNNPVPLYADNVGDNISIEIDGLMNSDSIAYQWYKNDVAIKGATSNIYNLGSNFKIGDYFYCVVTNTYNVISVATAQSHNFLVQE